jgi:hypothetical protein
VKTLLPIVFFGTVMSSLCATKGVCDVLEKTPIEKSGRIVEFEALLDGWLTHGYKLFDGSSRTRCMSSSKTLQLRPILAFCSMEPSRCPAPGPESKIASAELRRIISELNATPRSKRSRGVRLKVRAILVYPPDIQVMCDDDICWGSGFGDGSIAAAVMPLSVERAD